MLIGGKARTWTNHGRIVAPRDSIHWLRTCAGSAGTLATWDDDHGIAYVSGRDEKNRSIIGRVRLSVADKPEVVNIDPEPAFSFGSLGAFDENGVSYPSLVHSGGEVWMYYSGWMPSVVTPFQNHIGLARSSDGRTFERVSRAPILPRTDADHLWLGSMYVMKDADRFRMWYTACLEWIAQDDGPPLHRYLIKYAESDDGLSWRREDHIAIDFVGDEFAVARPSVIHFDGQYHMWFCTRGEFYKLGYAVSPNGVEWERRDDAVGLAPSGEAWDRDTQCYPAVFVRNGRIFMLYNGNGYGREGLGIAELRP